MTKPANFPERKRLRQERALERLERNPNPVRKSLETDAEFAARKATCRASKDQDRRVLLVAVVAGSQRDVRTKKYRGHGREYERAPK